MSTRRAARSLDDRVAAIEEFVRRLQADTAVTPTDVRFLYSARGDILYAAAANDPVPLAIGASGTVMQVSPAGLPAWQGLPELLSALTGPGIDGSVLTKDSTTPLGVLWV